MFKKQSGLGSAAIAHTAAQSNSPVQQGVIAMLGTFIDSTVVCTMTALAILPLGVWVLKGVGGGLTGVVLTSEGNQNIIAGTRVIRRLAHRRRQWEARLRIDLNT